MSETMRTDICVIGGGSAGLSVAAGAAQMGARVILFEKGRMGGDCLNYGCVPSKSLIAAAHRADAIRRASRFGINGHVPTVHFPRVRDHVRGVIAAIAPSDSAERFEGLGVKVMPRVASFSGPDEVTAGDLRVRARRYVIATGSTPAIPPISGLAEVPFLTNETVFDLAERPERLIVIGGGPIGCELAQAFCRLGIRVTLLEIATLLVKDDPEATAVVRERMDTDGVDIREGVRIDAVESHGNSIAVRTQENGTTRRVEGSHLLVAVGRTPCVQDLNLEAAGVHCSVRGIEVDRRLRTANKRVFAIGDVTGGYQFTHMASYHAGIVIRNALFHLPARVRHDAVPWVTYTDPELAHVGLNEAAARQRFGDRVRVARWRFEENDRAQAERETAGRIKVVTKRNGRILGATIVGLSAGELILPWVLAINHKLKISALANSIAPYPTLSEVSKRVAGAYYAPALFSKRTRKIVSLLQRLP